MQCAENRLANRGGRTASVATRHPPRCGVVSHLARTTQPVHTAPGSPLITQAAGMPQPAPPPTARCAALRNKLTCGPRQGQLTALQQVECFVVGQSPLLPSSPSPHYTTGPHSPRQPPDHTGGGNATASAATNRTVRRAAQQADVWTTPRPIDCPLPPATSGVLVVVGSLHEPRIDH